MSTVFIYTLREPGGPVRYIGKTKDSSTRLRYHLKEARAAKKKSHRNYWIRSLLEKNEIPVFDVIDEVDESDWQAMERFWIGWFRKMGFELVNGTDGGDGVHNPSLTARKNMSDAHKGKGRPQPESAKIKLRAARLGKPLSPEHCKKLSLAHTGVPWSAEQRRKRQEWFLNNPGSMKGKKHSPEAIEKMSQGHLRYYERKRNAS